ncbi:MAG: hypothetical protein ABIL58_14325 [Pseudomonadota bacterium]
MMAPQTDDNVLISATIEVPAAALQVIVETARQMSGRNQKGHYQVDTAEMVNRLLTRFVMEKDFVGYVSDRGNYE